MNVARKHKSKPRQDDGFALLASPQATQTDAAVAPDAAVESPASVIPFFQLFQLADNKDKVLMFVGVLGAIVTGMLQPFLMVFISDMINTLNPREPVTKSTLVDNINDVSLKFMFVACTVLVSGMAQVACWTITASRQTERIRNAYVRAILSKEIGWYDVNDPTQLATKVADSTVAIQEGTGRKVGDGVSAFASGLAGVVVGLYYGWQLTLVLLACVPILSYSATILVKASTKATQAGMAAYSKAGAIAQESIANVKTVHMVNSVPHFVHMYATALEPMTKVGVRGDTMVGVGVGLITLTKLTTYAIGIYFGAYKVTNDQLRATPCEGSGCYDGGKVFSVFFSVLFGAVSLAQCAPALEAVAKARAAAFDVFALINERSSIDPFAESGKKLDQAHGDVELHNVKFAYPSRPEVIVCNKYSLTIRAGETVALVGPSGSGKSTVVSLLERFYDPLEGSVKFDGVDIRELNVEWLRQQIGLVGQEPVLFGTSIMENIRHGRPTATDQEVLEAAKMANAYSFIMEFPGGFDTQVGDRGAMLSGGQKQRIAIARAIIKNPTVLLLDEATSALDTESERVVQESLDRLLASSKRTTIIVAHRLSTIRNADRIAVHNKGSIIEIGTHRELMAIPNGHYKKLVEAQSRTGTMSTFKGHSLVNDSSRSLGSLLASSKSIDRLESWHRSVGEMDALMEEHRKVFADLDKAKVADGEAAKEVSLTRLWKQTLVNWKHLVLGVLGAVLNSLVYPLWGVLLARIFLLLVDYRKSKSEMLNEAGYRALGFFGIGVFFFLTSVLQKYGFGVASHQLVSKMRVDTLEAIPRQEIAWFDMPANAPGALVSSLATDPSMLHAMTVSTDVRSRREKRECIESEHA